MIRRWGSDDPQVRRWGSDDPQVGSTISRRGPMMACSQPLITLISDGPTEATTQQVRPTDGFQSLA